MPWFALAALFAFRISSPVVDLDLFHQMALAREWFATGQFPRVDSFAFTPTVRPLMHHEWGAGVIAYAVTGTLGGTGLMALKYAVGLLFAALCVRLALRMGGRAATVLALGPIAVLLVGAGYGPIRAQAYSFLFAGVTLWCCERDRRGERRWLLLLPPLFVVWVNLHAGFVIGLLLLLIHSAELFLERRPARHVLALVGVLVGAVALNPYGFAYYRHLARSLSQDRHLIMEWDPIWSASVILNQRWAFLLSLLFLGYGLAFGRARPRRGLLHLAAMGVLALQHARMLPFYGMVWMAYTPALLRGSLLSESARRTLARWPATAAAATGALGVAAAALLVDARPWELRVPNEPLSPDANATLHYPVGAVNFLRSRDFHGAALTSFGAGSYVSWKLHPKVKVSLDSRFEAAYPYDLAERLIRLYQTGRGLQEVLSDYKPDVLLVPRESALASASIPWRRVYQDPGFALYARPDLALAPATAPVPTVDAFP
ncbi:MAG TPA: hypothetical protein VFE30_01290 [Anaeromyxobacteraceae bacterium]|nr:hypothetical protein [Anaeromyxobacteraceae bacterium]